MSRPTIALLTDFGTRDHYVGTMKGVALGICPEATLVDVTHDVPPHDILAGAFELEACYRYFPAGTVFLVVVDPGVGSSRRGIALEVGDFRFVAPDNGVLSTVLSDATGRGVVELTERRYARPTVSRTFEGRDRFAPAAAWLARGIDLGALGRSAGDCVRLKIPVPSVSDDAVLGEVVHIDRFGNLITNIDRAGFEKIVERGSIDITIGDRPVGRFVDTYSDAGEGEVCALLGSSDHVEVALNTGSAAALLGIARGVPVEIRRTRE